MTTALSQLRSFLDDHPDEVVTLMIQDSIDPVDAEAAFRDAGLDGLLYDGSADAEWPTLGELIDRHQRLIVFSEQHGSPGAWYQQRVRAHPGHAVRRHDRPTSSAAPTVGDRRRTAVPPQQLGRA